MDFQLPPLFRREASTLNRPPVGPDLHLGPASAIGSGLGRMARLAQALQVVLVIRAALCFGRNVINLVRCLHSALKLACLAQVLVSRENASPELIPLAAISSGVS